MRKQTYYKPNMAALRGRKGKEIIEFIRNQVVVSDADIKARADECIERIIKLREQEKRENRE